MTTFVYKSIINFNLLYLSILITNLVWAQPIDKVVAIVNDQVITQNQFNQRLGYIKNTIAKENVNISEDQISDEVMQSLIQESVVMQYANAYNFAPSDDRVESVLKKQAEADNISIDELKRNLTDQGLSTSTVEQQIAMQMIITYIRENIISSLININSVEIDAYLSNKMGADISNKEAEVNVAHIVIKVPENSDNTIKQKAYQKAQAVLAEAQKGVEFSDLAARYSDFSDASNGGLLGYRPQNRLPTIYEQVLIKLNIGDISPILESSNGYHIIKLIDRRHNTLQEVERIRASHILIRPKSGFTEDKALKEILNLYNRILADEDFAAIAANYSQDISAQNNGDLGWLYPGDTVRTFELAMSSLKTGEISEPVRTIYGWHIIKVTGRELVPLPVNKARQLATRALIEEKSTNEFNNWLNEQVAKAFIRIID